MSSRHSALALCVSVLLSASLAGQPAAPDRERLVDVARQVMEEAGIAALITLDAEGQPQARAMDPLPPDADMVVRMATNPRSRKVRHIRESPKVVLFYFDPESQSYVTLKGYARLVEDVQQIRKAWKTEWDPFYPDGPRSALLIEVMPERLEVVSGRENLGTDPTTWTPPSVEFPRRPAPEDD